MSKAQRPQSLFQFVTGKRHNLYLRQKTGKVHGRLSQENPVLDGTLPNEDENRLRDCPVSNFDHEQLELDLYPGMP